ncbi:TetR/AcrR family transcriptional regulator C-terminal domain-containing protein [Streptomyces sp. NPDC006923]|uniref:TetR/AcrR family transcriptional regulator C-terminal domain-containing protein n=1 Tax=Streptomyces sp. NPDC006923 TaxID=3155355 RepID=UPI0033F93E2C
MPQRVFVSVLTCCLLGSRQQSPDLCRRGAALHPADARRHPGSGTATLCRHFAGFPAGLAARTFTAVSHYVIGVAAQQHGPGSADPDSASALAAFYRGLDPATYPAITAAAQALTRTPLDEEFHFGLALLVNGLEPVMGRPSGTP